VCSSDLLGFGAGIHVEGMREASSVLGPARGGREP
jgi:hypothetical protein